LIPTLIVDDDIAMLKGLRKIISWEEQGFEIVGEAENGEDALALVKSLNPALIVADITMPRIDGLELTRQAKALHPSLKSLILTCHEEFPYARDAISAAADDYLVKHSLTKEELVASLVRIRGVIEQESLSLSRLVTAQETLRSNRYAILEDVVHDLLSTEPSRTEEEVFATARSVGVELPPDKYVAIGLFLDNLEVASEWQGAESLERLRGVVLHELESSLATEPEKFLVPLGHDFYLLLYWGYHSSKIAKKQLEGALHATLDRLAKATRLSGCCCVADGFEGVGQVSNAVRELRTLRSSCFYESGGTILTEMRSFDGGNAWDIYQDLRSHLRTHLNNREHRKTEEVLQRLFTHLELEQPDPRQVRDVMESILVDLGFVSNDSKLSLQVSFPKCDTLDGYSRYLILRIDEFFEEAAEHAGGAPRSDIERIKAYIDNHLGDPLRLDSISALVFMNKSYLSRLFKQETGETFSEYVMRRRVEKAKTLLQFTDQSIDEITEAIGLETASHFYRIFKKVTGTTPGAYRK
jgi:two-component system, response regulator YesN